MLSRGPSPLKRMRLPATPPPSTPVRNCRLLIVTGLPPSVHGELGREQGQGDDLLSGPGAVVTTHRAAEGQQGGPGPVRYAGQADERKGGIDLRVGAPVVVLQGGQVGHLG